MRILVTGGEGFIGSHLVRWLRDRGHKVVSFDKKSGEWCQDLSRLSEAADGCEFVYHLASTVGVGNVIADPSECINNNLDSLNNVRYLELPGIYTSSSEVYGTQKGFLKEDGPIVYSQKTRWSYAASKLCGEWLWNGDGRKSVRLFNVVGVGQNETYGAVFPTFIRQALSGEDITVHGDGSQIRSFTDVRDVVRLLDDLRTKDFDVVNVGHGGSVRSINGLAWEVLETTGFKSQLKHVPYPHQKGFQECLERVPDLSKLESLVGKQLYYGLEETIREVASVQARSAQTARL